MSCTQKNQENKASTTKARSDYGVWEHGHYDLIQVVLANNVLHIGVTKDPEREPIFFLASKRVLESLRQSNPIDHASFLVALKSEKALTFTVSQEGKGKITDITNLNTAADVTIAIVAKMSLDPGILVDEVKQICQFADHFHKPSNGSGLKRMSPQEIQALTQIIRQKTFLLEMEWRYIRAKREIRLM